MNDLQKRIVRNIVSHMAGRKPKMSIGGLSVESEIDKSLLAKLIRGERRMNVDQIKRIADALGLDPAVLLKK